ncbi:SGNH hydrolase-type esterase domain-containing protein [Zopfochytrium polystomum]|nr:SGNH hydrolase-type esterase domain-containing protein [Zopfochytrium polystomum]
MNRYARRLDVVNRGYAGFTTAFCKHFLKATLVSTLPYGNGRRIGGDHKAGSKRRGPEIRLVTLFLGANDAVVPDKKPRYHVPLDQYSANLREMIDTILTTTQGRARVLLIATPPANPFRWPIPDRSVERSRMYRDAGLKVAEEFRERTVTLDDDGDDRKARENRRRERAVVSLDPWQLFFGSGRDHDDGDVDADRGEKTKQKVDSGDLWSRERCDVLLSDGLHLSGEGSRLLYEGIVDTIEREWGASLGLEAIAPMIPWEHQLDVAHMPEAAFVNARGHQGGRTN